MQVASCDGLAPQLVACAPACSMDHLLCQYISGLYSAFAEFVFVLKAPAKHRRVVDMPLESYVLVVHVHVCVRVWVVPMVARQSGYWFAFAQAATAVLSLLQLSGLFAVCLGLLRLPEQPCSVACVSVCKSALDLVSPAGWVPQPTSMCLLQPSGASYLFMSTYRTLTASDLQLALWQHTAALHSYLCMCLCPSSGLAWAARLDCPDSHE
jgi:hypothetical protein